MLKQELTPKAFPDIIMSVGYTTDSPGIAKFSSIMSNRHSHLHAFFEISLIYTTYCFCVPVFFPGSIVAPNDKESEASHIQPIASHDACSQRCASIPIRRCYVNCTDIGWHGWVCEDNEEQQEQVTQDKAKRQMLQSPMRLTDTNNEIQGQESSLVRRSQRHLQLPFWLKNYEMSPLKKNARKKNKDHI